MTFPRTGYALILTSLAVAIPNVAWFVAGSRDVAKEGTALELRETQKVMEVANMYAQRVNDRLQTLLDTENLRPFYEYPSFHELAGEARDDDPSTLAPLKENRAEEVVETYFTVTPGQAVSLTGGALSSDRPLQPGEELLKRELQMAMPGFTKPAQTQFDYLFPHLLEADPSSVKFINWRNNKNSATTVAILRTVEWEKNLSSADWPAEGAIPSYGLLNSKFEKKPGQGIFITLPFKWTQLKLADESYRLAALRTVSSPRGLAFQGFIVSPVAFEQTFHAPSSPARLIFGNGRVDEVQVGLRSIPDWSVCVDPKPALLSAKTSALRLHSQFLRSFGVGLSLASLAGCCVLGLFWHVNRLTEQRTRFALSAAHELKTPLACLRMYAEMLIEGFGDPVKTKIYARRIEEETERLGRVVSNILAFSGLERQSSAMELQRGNLAEAVRECVEVQKAHSKSDGMTFDLAIPADLPLAFFNRDALFQIVQNLVDNAEKYSRESDNRTVRIALEATGTGVELSVADRGPGVPASLRASLFKPFERGKIEKGPEGLGLGLSISQSLAHALGTKIVYEENAGGGSVFKVNFPYRGS